MENSSLSDLLHEASVYLVRYLEKILPGLFNDWWKDGVMNTLSYQQQRRLEQQGINALGGLDLAALLRVLDQNWYNISSKMNYSPETRHFVKEMQTVRNRWAHVGAEGFNAEDIYRDMDTLQRFSEVMEADDGFIENIRKIKKNLIVENTVSSHGKTGSDHSEFTVGQIVCLKADPSVTGAVIGVLPGQPENRYIVFQNGKQIPCYASQLKAEEKTGIELTSLAEFHAHLSALQIRHPSLSALYSLNSARISFIPYQFRPVLKFIRAERPRMLIADSLGIGKTIEAGLILRELQARRDIKSVLIICTKPLIVERKWEIEMKRFDERFIPLDGKTLRYCIREHDLGGVWPDQYQKIMLPYSLLDEDLLKGRKNGKGLLELDPPPRFDLVIVDEAHHIRNPETFSHKGVRFFCDHAEAVLFLTATPVQLGSNDLFVLLNMLRPDLIIDEKSFEHMAAPNPHINRAIDYARSQIPDWQDKMKSELNQAAQTPWGKSIFPNKPEYCQIDSLLKKNSMSDAERISCISAMERLYTFSDMLNRTRRCDIGNFTIRKPQTVLAEFTPQQRQLHDDLMQVQADILSRLHGDKNIIFMMTTIRRQAASCLFGLIPMLEDILTRKMDDLALHEANDTGNMPEGTDIGKPGERILEQILNVLSQSEKLDSHDPKLEQLRTIIKDKQNMPNNKIMVFSSFRHTLAYLLANLKTDEFRVAVIHGGVADEERLALRKRFELERNQEEAIDVMLFSEVGCEGLDYQFCDCMVNYDIPWNPMKIDQRIGRIDRQGQRSETVAIYNFITPGTVDADIYRRCLERIGVFQRALGGNEEILGNIAKELKDVAESFSLTQEEQDEKFRRIADNNIRLIQEQEALEERQAELFGLRVDTDRYRQEVEKASSYWLSPSSVHNLLSLYLKNILGQEQDCILGEKEVKTLRLSQEVRDRLLRDFQLLQRQSSEIYRNWEKWLKGSHRNLKITFDAKCASENPDAVFLMPVHPLIRQAAAGFEKDDAVITAFSVAAREILSGDYPFAIYQWRFFGIRDDLVLQAVCNDPDISSRFFDLLEKGRSLNIEKEKIPGTEVFDSLDVRHYELWVKAKEDHIAQTRQIANYRKESLNTSHKARLNLIREQFSQATNEKIRKMRQAQMDNAEADYGRRIQEIDAAIAKADIVASVVGFGIIRITEENKNVQ
ncbi:MAG: helicase-related protein [Desulfococcaceae bacterium]